MLVTCTCLILILCLDANQHFIQTILFTITLVLVYSNFKVLVVLKTHSISLTYQLCLHFNIAIPLLDHRFSNEVHQSDRLSTTTQTIVARFLLRDQSGSRVIPSTRRRRNQPEKRPVRNCFTKPKLPWWPSR